MRLLRGADFRNLWLGETVSLFGDQVTLIALPLAAVLVLDADAAEMGYLTRGGAHPAPALLASGRSLAGTRGAQALADDRLRRREGRLSRQHPDRLCVRLAHVRAALRVAFLDGDVRGLFDISYMTLYVAVDEREDYVEANSLLNGSRSFSYVAGPSVGGILVQILSAPAALLAGRSLLRRIGALPRPDPGAGASARARREAASATR